MFASVKIDGIDSIDPQLHPDSAPLDSLEISNIFVISRYSNGDILSVYGDQVWDLTPYSSIISTTSIRINFSRFSTDQIPIMKKVAFALLYHSQAKSKNGLSVHYILKIINSLRALTEFADARQLSVTDVLCKIDNFKKFLRSGISLATASSVNSLVCNLIGGSDQFKELNGLTYEHIKLTRKIIKQFPQTNQTVVIPQNILSNLISELDELFFEIENCFPRLMDILEKMTRDRLYGRGKSTQQMAGCKVEHLRPFFGEVAKEHDLDSLFRKYRVKTMNQLTRFLRQLLHASQVKIALFSGMRFGEILFLEVGCLTKESTPYGQVYQISGYTSKFSGQKVKAKWITDKTVYFPIQLCEALAKLSYETLELDLEEIPLFISPRYALTPIPRPTHAENVIKVASSNGIGTSYELLDFSKLAISQKDTEELKSIEPFREWDSEEKFAEGQEWPFSFHQFRRTLAFYAIQKGLVSLPSLRSQFKHLTRGMAVGYGQSRGISKASERTHHFKEFMWDLKPEADLICYINELFESKEPLQGLAGRALERQKEKQGALDKATRLQILSSFKEGSLAISETPLGACLSIAPCNLKAVGNLTACISCKDAVIKPSKLNKVILRQKGFLDECKRSDFDDFEYRYEKRELEILVKLETQLLKNDDKNEKT